MFKNLSRSLFILLISFSVHAADTIAVNPDMGKPGEPVEDVVSGKIDVAIMWGPLGGYYAKQSDVDLVVVEIPEYSTGNKKLQGKTYWNISAGVRKREVERREMVEGAIFRNLDKIYAIMDEYGIPHTEPIFVDRLDGYKRHKK